VTNLVCDKCSAVIAVGARFCPNCADPVTDADRPAATTDLARQRVRLVCPKCEAQELYEVDLGSARPSVVCPKCRAAFQSHLTVIRAKRSSGSKKENRRSYSIRVQNFDGREELVEFVNAGTSDFELRSKDIAAFSYLNGQLAVVQNMKVNQYMKVSKPSCFVASCVYGVDSREVRLLRTWRDHHLIVSPGGAHVVEWYYLTSAPLVRAVGDSPAAKYIGRIVLSPVIWSVRAWAWAHCRARPSVRGLTSACSRRRQAR
jgi:hypothetical protein